MASLMLAAVIRCFFNEVVANQYHVYDKNIPYHTDANGLLDENPTIISISVGPTTGAFCYAPDSKTGFGRQWGGGRKQSKIKKMHKEKGVQGIVPLEPGDILVMWGGFQRYFVHKTLRHCRVEMFQE